MKLPDYCCRPLCLVCFGRRNRSWGQRGVYTVPGAFERTTWPLGITSGSHTCGSPQENRVFFFVFRPKNRPSADPPASLSFRESHLSCNDSRCSADPGFRQFFFDRRPVETITLQLSRDLSSSTGVQIRMESLSARPPGPALIDKIGSRRVILPAICQEFCVSRFPRLVYSQFDPIFGNFHRPTAKAEVLIPVFARFL